MSRFVFTIGLPRSGKSSYGRALAKNENLIMLSGDDFRLALTGERFNFDSELFVRASLVAAAKALLMTGYNVLIDETNSSEYHYTQLLNLHPSPEVILFHSTPEICKQRAEDCNQRDLIPVIDRINSNLEILTNKILSGNQDKRLNKDTILEVGLMNKFLFSKTVN